MRGKVSYSNEKWLCTETSLQSRTEKTIRFTAYTGENLWGTITKKNKWGGIIKDDIFMITCADRANWMAGLVRHPHIGVQIYLPS